jgi:twinkle protein
MAVSTEDQGTFLKHIPCESCGSSDANALYDDGHTHCFACQARTGSGGGVAVLAPDFDPLAIDPMGKTLRGITPQTFEFFGYGTATYRGDKVHVAPYHDKDGRLVAQHLRTQDKKFPWVGDVKKALPFGATRFPRTGKKLVVTEGELDCLAMSQVQGNKYPVVSIGCGAGPQVKKYIAQHRDYFLGFEEVVLMFDMDEPGRDATQLAAEVLGTRARIAELPLKDPNEMLKAGQTRELLDAMWRARPYRPEGLVEAVNLKAEVLAGIKMGVPWPWPILTEMTYGRRTGEIYTVGAATGSGKSDLLTEIIDQTITDLHEPVGVFFLEQQPRETTLRVLGKMVGKRFHIPNGDWTQDDLAEAWRRLEAAAPLHLYDSFGINEWDVIRERIRFLVHSHGVKHIFLDHLTALAAAEADEREGLERIMAQMGGLVKELDIALYLISHLATPEGKSHEEGGRVTLRHFKGSRAIGFWSHFAFAMERDQQAEDELERHTTTFRVLKDRYTGNATGRTFNLRYLPETGMLEEVGEFDDTEAPAPGDI